MLESKGVPEQKASAPRTEEGYQSEQVDSTGLALNLS
jgi:hypothetical protein